MGHYTKEMRAQMDDIHNKIVAAHRVGVCDKDGNSVKDENGVFKAKPRNMSSSITQKFCNRCKRWYYIREGHECQYDI